MSSRRAGWLLVALAACGHDGEPAPDGVRSGSRLRARFLVDDEGARVFQGFLDTQLGLDCTFQGDPPRCLPPVSTTSIFRDAACSEPLVESSATEGACAVPAWVGIADDASCAAAPARIWRRGQRVERSEVYLVDATGACVARPARPDAEYHAMASEISLDRFVAGREEVTGVGRLRPREIVAEDGARLPVGFVDTVLDADCRYDDAFGTCVPDFIPQDLRGDPSCTVPVAMWMPSDCASPPRFVGRRDGTLHEHGDRVFASALYQGTDEASCASLEAHPGFKYYLEGPDALPRLATATIVLDDDRRLQGRYLTDEEGLLHRVGGLHDREQGIDCEPMQVAAEAWRCLPTGGSTVARYFEDRGCTRPVAILESRPPTAGAISWKPLPGIVWRPAGDDACASYAFLHEPGIELSPGAIYAQVPACEAVTWDRSEVRRFTIGPERPLDDYAPLRRMRE